jgi:hypothetical protein
MMDRQSHALRALALPALLAIMPLGCGGGESESAAPPAALPVSPAAPAAPPVAASGAALEYPAVLAKFTDSFSADARALIFNTKGVSLARSSRPSRRSRR